MEPTGMKSIIPEKVLEKVYDDAGAKPAKYAGEIAVDLLKAAHLFLAPIQLLGAVQDRFRRYFDLVRSRVPEARQTPAPASIAGPILEGLKYMEDNNPLKELYLNLLTCAMDTSRQEQAHPAFAKIIEQMSPDEARILAILKKRPVLVSYDEEVRFPDQTMPSLIPSQMVTNWNDIPVDALKSPLKFNVSFAHLRSLDLVAADPSKSEIQNQNDHDRARGVYRIRQIFNVVPTAFGELFMEACVPTNWETEVKTEP